MRTFKPVLTLAIAAAALCSACAATPKTDAVVVVDYIGEPLVLPVADRPLNIPADNLAVLLLRNDGSSTLEAWNSPDAEVVFDPETDSLKIEGAAERLTVHYPHSWYHATAKLNDADWQPVGWAPEYVADFRVVYLKDMGAIPPEDGRQEAWKVMPSVKRGMSADTSVAIYDGETWSNWISGYGTTIYPARADASDTYLRFLRAGEFPRQKHSEEFGGYVYLDSAATHPDYWKGVELPAAPEGLAMPRQAVKNFVGDKLWTTVSEVENEGKRFPATCSSTEFAEKIFYRGEAYKERKAIADRMANMDNFVRRIRERIEEFREWGKTESAWLKANAPESVYNAFKDDFAYYEEFYQKHLDRIQYPESCEKLSAEIVRLAYTPDGDEEELEDRCKELGRAIRTIGGTQDNMVAQFRRIAKCVRQKATELYAKSDSPEERAALLHVRNSAREHLHHRMPHEGK